MDYQYRTWIDISVPAIGHNYSVFRKLISPQTKLLGVVKSNAYGHELMGFARTLSELGADFLGVDSISEAVTLRKIKIKKPVLVLGYTLPANFEQAAKLNTSLTISSFENLKLLKKVHKPLKIHLKIDTGMHRQGFDPADFGKLIKAIRALPKIIWEGIYTHFAAAKKPDSNHSTAKQIKSFEDVLALARASGFKGLAHAAASAGTLNYPESHFDMVRIGIGMYGLWPSPEIAEHFKDLLSLRPVMSWKTLISEIKTVEKNEKIGYDYTEGLTRKSRLAVLPVGYWHGYWRAFSSKAYVLVKGQKCRVVGRVAMDMIVVDITDVPNTKVGDEVVLIGSQRGETASAEELAELANTSNYEIVTRINPLIKKFFINR